MFPNGKKLFLITLIASIAAVVAAVVAGAASATAGIVLGVALAGLWAVYVVWLLYAAGHAITRRARPGEAATSILLAFLVTPVVLAAPLFSLAAPALQTVRGLGGITSAASPTGTNSDLTMPTDVPTTTDSASSDGSSLNSAEIPNYLKGATRSDFTEAQVTAAEDALPPGVSFQDLDTDHMNAWIGCVAQNSSPSDVKDYCYPLVGR